MQCQADNFPLGLPRGGSMMQEMRAPNRSSFNARGPHFLHHGPVLGPDPGQPKRKVAFQAIRKVCKYTRPAFSQINLTTGVSGSKVSLGLIVLFRLVLAWFGLVRFGLVWFAFAFVCLIECLMC